jgi:hypothetical protein
MRWAGGVAAMLAVVLAGCGLDVKSADLFLLTRSGQGRHLQLLVNDSGTISCDGRAAKPLPDALLLRARDLAATLDTDAKSKLRFAATPSSVFSYTIKLQDGTLSFPDTAASQRSELAGVELWSVQVAEGPCGLRSQ